MELSLEELGRVRAYAGSRSTPPFLLRAVAGMMLGAAALCAWFGRYLPQYVEVSDDAARLLPLGLYALAGLEALAALYFIWRFRKPYIAAIFDAEGVSFRKNGRRGKEIEKLPWPDFEGIGILKLGDSYLVEVIHPDFDRTVRLHHVFPGRDPAKDAAIGVARHAKLRLIA
jgi:hypothetical protein